MTEVVNTKRVGKSVQVLLRLEDGSHHLWHYQLQPGKGLLTAVTGADCGLCACGCGRVEIVGDYKVVRHDTPLIDIDEMQRTLAEQDPAAVLVELML